ncbi:MAG: hypothetical protein JEY91_10000 [Spirochaetaceae bacterium]|nr:hypothetical protein [Spirochaetaceae bacterium]
MISLTKKIPPSEKALDAIDQLIVKKLSSYDDEIQSTIRMVGIELLENALKYHMEKDISSSIEFKISINDSVEIKVTNLLRNTEDAYKLIEHVNNINSGIDPKVQYMHRLKEIMENRIPGESQLGLLRIVGEGNFGIQYNLKDNCLTVSATKYINRKRNRAMDSLITKDFSIIINDNDPFEVIWKGRSRDLNPSLVIDKYLDELTTHLLDRDILVDFSSMESLNSSTIPPILTFLTNLEKKRIRATVQYSKDVYWQRASFKPLSVLTRDFKFVKLLPV